MSIIGIGVDIVNNNRLKKLIKNHNFLQRVFTNKEQANSSDEKEYKSNQPTNKKLTNS